MARFALMDEPSPNRLREFRKEAGFAQEDLAYKTGLRFSIVSRIERGEHRPRLETARALAAVLSQALGRPISVDELFPPGFVEQAS